MITDRYKSFYLIMTIIMVATFSITITKGDNETTMKTEMINDSSKRGSSLGPRSLFSPRVDYNEWMPVGRGDPLKNDPTYDYSPPVLDRVRYWGDSNKDKNEILLLGVPSKRQSHKKDTKYSSIRRNYYSSLPTRLMPPPMQTISPSTKYPSTENYQGMYHSSTSYKQPSRWGHNNINSYSSDTHSDESINYVSISRPNSNNIVNKPMESNVQRKPWLHTLLQKESTKPSPNYALHQSQSLYETHSSNLSYSTFVPTTTTTTTEPAPYFQPTISPNSMTTDSLFSHYKQPAQPIQGPMYLIIEGHSKVKTYGLQDNVTKEHEAKIVPVPNREDPVIKHVVSKDENGQNLEVKHLHTTTTESNENKTESTTEVAGGMQSLLSLLDKSLGNFFLSDEPKSITNKTNPENDRIERESRQIFDYDQLPESELKQFNGDDILKEVTGEPKGFSDVAIQTELSTEMT